MLKFEIFQVDSWLMRNMRQYPLNQKFEREFFIRSSRIWKAEWLFLVLVNAGAKETSPAWECAL